MNPDDLRKVNSRAVKTIKDYQAISFWKKHINTPYFINLAESVYKDAFRSAGVPNKKIHDAIHQIKDGKTPLSSNGGKETPEQIRQSLIRLSDYLLSRDYDLGTKSTSTIRTWMKLFHIGLDCSGFVYNVLNLSLDPALWEHIKALLSWKDPTRREASQAGVFVLNSPKLLKVTALGSLKPLDLCIYSNNSHIGLVVEIDNMLHLAESSIGEDGISVKRIKVHNQHTINIDQGESWNKAFKSKNVIVRRFLSI